MMIISIITPTYNSSSTLEDTLKSITKQKFIDIEHIVVDGMSSDATLAVIEDYEGHTIRLISESDDGIYDAYNKGYEMSCGDVVTFLNSDDYYANAEVLQRVADIFSDDPSIDIVCGGIEVITASGEVVRRWMPAVISNGAMKEQLPYPACFFRTKLIERLETPFDASYRISADFKQLLLLVDKLGAKVECVPEVFVKFRVGGLSTSGLFSYLQGWTETIRAYNEIFGKGGWFYVIKKVLRKLLQITSFKRFLISIRG